SRGDDDVAVHIGLFQFFIDEPAFELDGMTGVFKHILTKFHEFVSVCAVTDHEYIDLNIWSGFNMVHSEEQYVHDELLVPVKACEESDGDFFGVPVMVLRLIEQAAV